MPTSLQRSRAKLVERLRSRHEEIVQAALIRVHAVSDPTEIAEGEYREGLRPTVAAALEYGAAAFECSDDRSPPIPTELLTQARLAARNRITLDAVMRRYIAGYTVFGDFVVEAAEEEGISSGSSLKRLLRVQASLFDRLLSAVTEEYNREAGQPGSTAERRLEQVRRLLAGELLDAPDLRYDFGAHHVGLVLAGAGAGEALRGMLARLDCQSLLIPTTEKALWAWLGSRQAIDPAEILDFLAPPKRLAVAIGEPGKGLAGWRLTHEQAKVVLRIAERGPDRVVRYREAALLASIVADDLLTVSLRQLFLTPLEGERTGGDVARKTLRAYFAAARNVTSTAATLRVTRNTVTNRLGAVEEAIGSSLATCATEVEIALQVEELGKKPIPTPANTAQNNAAKLSKLPPRKVT
jgi:hypothetical protein